MIEAGSEGASSADAQMNLGQGSINPRAAMIAQFRKLHAPVFDGAGSAEEAEQFLREIEKTCRLLQSSEDEKLAVTEYQLKGAADEWWETVGETVRAQSEGSAWENFKAAFMERFLPEATRENKASEFEMLTQGSMTFEQYGKEFTRLAKYAPHLVSTPAMRARRFEKGANSPISDQLIGLNLPTYEEVLRRGLLIENARARRKELGSSSAGETSKAKRPHLSSSGDSGRFQRVRSRGGFSGTTQSSAGSVGMGRNEGGIPPMCSRCRRHHFGIACPRRQIICFECGLPGHIRANCPRLMGAEGASVSVQQPSRAGSGATGGSINAGRGRGRGNVTTPSDAGATRPDVVNP